MVLVPDNMQFTFFCNFNVSQICIWFEFLNQKRTLLYILFLLILSQWTCDRHSHFSYSEKNWVDEMKGHIDILLFGSIQRLQWGGVCEDVSRSPVQEIWYSWARSRWNFSDVNSNSVTNRNKVREIISWNTAWWRIWESFDFTISRILMTIKSASGINSTPNMYIKVTGTLTQLFTQYKCMKDHTL